MPIVLHIGTHKTGTTSIQKFARRNEEPLKARGLWYPSYDRAGVPSSYAHHAVARAILDQVDGFTRDQAWAFCRSIEQRQKEFDTCLISAEPIYRMSCPQDVAELDHIAYWSARERFIVRLREFFSGDDIRILICLRRQDSFAESYYQEKVRATPYKKTFSEYLEAESQIFRYLKQVRLFDKYFESVDVLVYERLCENGLIESFFAHLGVDVSDLNKSRIDNVALPPDFIEFKRIMNLCELPSHQLQLLNSEMARLASSWGDREAFPTHWADPDQMLKFTQSFSKENEQLRLQFARHIDSPLFPELGTQTGRAYEGITLEKFAKLALLLRESQII